MTGRRRSVRVFSDIRWAEDPINPYGNEFVQAVGGRVELIEFSWRNAFLARYDVFHVNWPEGLFRTGSGRAAALGKPILAWLLLMRLWLLRVKVVRSAHNVKPHRRGNSFEQVFIALLDRLTTGVIYLNNSSENDYRVGGVVAHPLYPEKRLKDPAPERRDVLLFGLLRPFKGIDALVERFSEIADPQVGLVVAGAVEAENRDFFLQLEQLASRDPRVSLRPGRMSEDDLDSLLERCRLVALPYRDLYNSGALFLALSRGRPVLVPRNPVTEALVAEFGVEWIRCYDEPLDGRAISSALGVRLPATPPTGSGRDWATAGEMHARVYEIARAARFRSTADFRSGIETDDLLAAHSQWNERPGAGSAR